MKPLTVLNSLFRPMLLTLLILPLATASAVEPGGVEDSYHGQMGRGTGTGMLEKWCALPNFSYYQQGGELGWSQQSCNGCHIGAPWNPDPDKQSADCSYCHESDQPLSGDVLDIDGCLTCHWKDTAKRGDVFTADEDVHIAAGYLCQDCHLKMEDESSDHQFLKGTAIDTTETTMMGTLSCAMSGCHVAQPHAVNSDRGQELNAHIEKVACETCHTGLRPAKALESRKWNVFTVVDGLPKSPVTTKRDAGWLPEHKWYDNTGPGASGNYHLPILSHTERRDEPGAKIYPFNAVTVDWYVKKKNSSYDEVVTVPEVKAADSDGPVDGLITVTLDEMQAVYRKARLVTADMNFSISHSVVPADEAFVCKDCHGRHGWVLDWKQLGYPKDPRSKGRGNNK